MKAGLGAEGCEPTPDTHCRFLLEWDIGPPRGGAQWEY